MTDATQRFSSRVDDYVKYRPSYPPQVVALLQTDCNLKPESIIADIGSGTGLLTELFLRNGNLVYGVEPNRAMRAAGERYLANYSNFKSIDGRAEATTLADHSVDFVTAGQAFHWFDRLQARAEFERILKPQGWVALIWNKRRKTSTPFSEAYEELLTSRGTDYQEVRHERISDDQLRGFFDPVSFRLQTFDYEQVFDYAGLRGRLLSSSYTPQPGHPNYEPMLERLRAIFETHQVNGQVTVEYDTQVYYGHI